MKPVQPEMKTSRLLFSLILAASLGSASAGSRPAFAGAEGFGRFATGGQGGETVHVTTLADSGPGSLREAVSRPGRIVVFDVGGMIRLKSNLPVSNRITLAGQTAPGEGILIYGRSVSFSGGNQVIARYLRFREGINGDKGKCAVNLSGGSNMIFDHCSIEWGRWDCLGLTRGSHDITFQYCIIGEGVGPQSFGSLSDDVTNITYSHNLWINNKSRNPKAKGQIVYINNVVYNWGVCGLVGGHSGGDHYLDAVGNIFIAGPHSSNHPVGECKPTDHIYSRDNWASLGKTGQFNPRPVVPADFGQGDEAPTLVASPVVAQDFAVTVEPARIALDHVLAQAGCSQHRDAVDARLIDSVASYGQRGQIIRSETEVGGPGNWPEVHAPANLAALDQP